MHRIAARATAGALMCLVLVCTAACLQQKDSGSSTSSPAPAAQPAPGSAAVPPAAEQPATDATSTPPTHATETPDSGKATETTDKATPEVEDEDKVTRPQRSGSTDFLPIDLTFLKAEFNDEAEADLSRLSFQFRAKLDRMQYVEDSIELSSYRDSPCGVLKLPQCMLEVYPQVAGPDSAADRAPGRRAIDIEGRYVLVLRTLEGKLIGKFSIDGLGGLAPAMPDQWGKGYAAVLRWQRDSQREDGYEIRRTDAAGLSKKSDALFGLRYDGVGYETLTVSDPQGNKFSYKFPSGQLQLLLIK